MSSGPYGEGTQRGIRPDNKLLMVYKHNVLDGEDIYSRRILEENAETAIERGAMVIETFDAKTVELETLAGVYCYFHDIDNLEAARQISSRAVREDGQEAWDNALNKYTGASDHEPEDCSDMMPDSWGVKEL